MNNTIKNALISALLTFVWTMAEFWLGWHTTHYEVGKYTGAVALVFPVWLLWRSLKAARSAAGPLGFGQGAKLALVFGVVSSAAAIPSLLLYYKVINPAFQPQPDAAEYVMIAVAGVVMGLVIGLIETALLRRRPRTAEKIASKHG